ncbi:ricin-type beta-trefoil lectin domain protein [Longispora sp. K20-0274]|uniref:ricin-type beta-trefoil lectin domain protein n=1 Tax=Longispora sp. K20-0274 TaxID=3088255 RepID=UPI00399BBFC2
MAGLLTGVPALAAPGSGAGGLSEPSSTMGAVATKPGTPSSPGITSIDNTTLPSAGSAVVTVDAAAVSIGGAKVEADSVAAPEPLSARSASRTLASEPVSPASVQVSVVDPAKAATLGAGVLLSVTRADGGSTPGPAQVTLDYSSFANAFGAGYGARLRLVQVPACALTTPELAECQTRTELGSTNAGGKVSARVPVPPAAVSSVVTPALKGARSSASMTESTSSAPMAMAAVSGSSGAGGDFTATSLSQTSSWAAGSQGGEFSYSVPFGLPPGTGGPVAQVSLGYDSGGADGQTSAANGQSSWVGEGWDYQPGFIERSYRPCKTDGTGTTSDNCWFSDNATMLWNGHSMPLVLDTATGVWHGADDDGVRVERLNDTSLGNGDNDGEYWKLTDKDGVQYFFGKNKRYAGDTMTTDSVLTVPVYGNTPGEPCYATPIQFARCQQAYRWNLDYVLDPRGNSMTYHYQRYLGRTGLLGNAAWGVVQYQSASALDWVEYGTRAGSEGTTGGSARVEFGVTNRCINACTGSDYPDAAWDTFCWSDTSCPNTPVPVYLTPWKLSSVTTKVWTGSTYRPVDRWDLAHSFRDAVISDDNSGVTPDKHLWLDSVTHTGYAPDGTSQAEPAVSFLPTPLANRVSYGSTYGLSAYGHNRISTVRTGHGSETRVAYSGKECAPQFVPVSDSNPYRCFPQYGQYDQGSAAGYAWFHKYVVDSVTEVDLTDAAAPDEKWAYTYSTAGSSDNALWRIANSEGSEFRFRSWSSWAGYATVTTVHGAGGSAPTQTSATVYHRGMDDDARATADQSVKEWTARRAGATMPLGTPNMPAQTAGTGGMCIDRPATLLTDGTGIQIADCNNDYNQMWWRSNDTAGNSRWINPQSGKCLDLVGGSAWPGTRIQLMTCQATATQYFQEQPNGSLKNTFSGRCLDTNSAARTSGTQLVINDCDVPGSYHQQFLPNNNHALVSTDANRCLNLSGSVGNGGLVRTDNCGSITGLVVSQAANWTLRTDGSLFSAYAGRCLDLTGGGTAAGTPVQLWDCVSTNGVAAANQTWVAQADGSLKNPASGRCLDPGDNALMATTPTLADCQAATRRVQRWNARIIDAKPITGKPLEARTLNGDGSVAAATTHSYAYTLTGHRPSPIGGPMFDAYRTNEPVTGSRTWIAAIGNWRRTQTEATFDTYNLRVEGKDQGDLAVTGDETCTHIDYARDTGAKYFIAFPWQTLTTTCAASPGDADFLSGSQIDYDGAVGYDGPARQTAPTAGLPTKTLTLAGVSGGVKDWKRAGRIEYDTNGRPVTTYDPLNRKSTVGFTPASGPVAVTGTTTTNPANWTSTATLDAGRGLPLTATDANNKTTTIQYDPLGRLTKGWSNNRPTSATPDMAVTYTVSNTVASWVKSSKLGPNGNVIDSYALYDGRFRPRQTQGITQDGKAAVATTIYDSVGRAAKSSVSKNNAAPASTLLSVSDANAVSQHRFVFDNLGRVVTDELWGAGVKHSQTSTAYDGDRVTVTPPGGGTAATSFSDAHGRATTLRQFLGSAPTGSFQDTTFGYDRLGRQTSSVSAGSTWTTAFDLRGRVTSKSDPDTGTTTLTYDDAGQLLTTTDSRSIKLAYDYDNLGRKTGVFINSTGGTKLASWVFDTLAKGQLTSSTRHDTTGDYTTAVTGFDDGYRPLGSSVTIPSSAGTLAGVYSSSSTYKVNGAPASVTYPAAGGLAAETVNFTYNSAGQQTTVAGLDTYLADVTYFFDGGVYQTVMGAGDKRVKVTTSREDVTGRLTTAQVDTERAGTPGTFDEQYTEKYSYDLAGNVLGINDTKAGATVSNQCFGYDGLRRMTESWTTAAAACQTSPSSGVLGGADPYWTSYTFDPAGNRATELKHAAPGGGLATDTLRTYTTPGAGQPKTHSLTKVDTKVGTATATTTDSFTYDNTGNTLTHNTAGYTWNELGKLVKVAVSGGPTTDMVYDADGNRILRKDSTGTTVYLGGTELHANTPSSAPTCTRTYPGAVRTADTGLSWMVADHHGTGQTSIKASDLTVTRRRTDPFGGPRGTAVAWPTQRGFVDGVNDLDTKLVHIGARDYDTALGRFVSVDPVFDGSDPQSWQGYAYGNNSPATLSDPSGLNTRHDDGGGSKHVFAYELFDNGVVMNLYSDGEMTIQGNTFNPLGVEDLSEFGTVVAKYYGQFMAVPGHERADPVVATSIAIAQGCASESNATLKCSVLDLTLPNTKAYCNRTKVCDGDMVDVQIGVALGILAYWQHGASGGRSRGRASSVRVNSGGCGDSFTPDTPVLMADGTARPIKDIGVGEQVWSTDPESGKTSIKSVTQLHLNNDSNFTDVTVVDGNGQASVIHTTQEHPFWEVSGGRWTAASELKPGDKLYGPNASVQHVGLVRSYFGQQWMHNLTIADIHTYYVFAGLTPVLVHNACFDLEAASASGRRTDPADKGGELSVAGRSLQKKVGRDGNAAGWPTPAGKKDPKAWSRTGEDMLDEILTNPGSTTERGRGRIDGQWADVIDIRLPNGKGARFNSYGVFSGFLDEKIG